jgi:prolipoprotein diacylglyceryltransferase
VLATVHGVHVHSYPAFLYLGLVGGIYVAAFASPHGSSSRIAAATVLLLVPALLGARLLFVASHWDLYRHDLRRILDRSEGGMAMYGGLLLAIPLSPLVLHAFGLGFAAFWDAATVTMITGTVLTRIGCFLNGCCTGSRVPTALLESAGALVLLAAELAFWPHAPFAGAVFLTGLSGYGILRLALEPTRGSGRGLTSGRVVSAAAVLVCLPLFLVLWLT